MALIIEQFAHYCGRVRYEKFLTELIKTARHNGQLHFWQEELIEAFGRDAGVHLPTELNSLLSLYQCEPVVRGLSEETAGLPPAFRVPRPFYRSFRWVNQAASGGSHVTIFSVKIETSPDVLHIKISDLSAPHERPHIAPALLGALADGIRIFAPYAAERGKSEGGLHVTLLEYADHEIDLHPRRYAFAMRFILEDLLCDQLADRHVVNKQVGVPRG